MTESTAQEQAQESVAEHDTSEKAVDARRREDETARLIVSVGVAGGIACCAVAAAANTGRYAVAFVASAVCFLAASGAGLLAVVTPATVDGGGLGRLSRRQVTVVGVGGLFVALLTLVFSSVLVALS